MSHGGGRKRGPRQRRSEHCDQRPNRRQHQRGILGGVGVRNFDVCIVAISGNFQSSLETTSLLKELGAKMVVSRAERDVQANFCCATVRMRCFTRKSSWPSGRPSATGPTMCWIISSWTTTNAILEVSVPSAWIGKTVGDINIRKKYSINILGIKRNGIADVNIDSDTVLPVTAHCWCWRGQGPEPVLSYLIVCKGSGSIENGTADFAVSGRRTFSCFYRCPM